jgi:hypothetical protein
MFKYINTMEEEKSIIDKYKLKLRGFSVDLDGQKLDRKLRTLLTIEVDIENVEFPDNHDGTYDQVYKSALVGSVIVKQGNEKPIVTKSKRSWSQKWKTALWGIDPEEEFYETIMIKLLNNVDAVIDFLRDK